ncbi:hypothetical protein PAXRUDRAFT_15401 [Paxillus rubicundulus Ve08.2h10]|uniref:Uncharacterized protein n=1 Tax=Paxillus rubicundulus Ve08.2h10 TaxID=930991 RepID=A0A0D0DAX0_9AGAM|nr:hypothetical protein PAXRUDRAFT_15401 [Paxillus rubicundulus Ve08.2h10]
MDGFHSEYFAEEAHMDLQGIGKENMWRWSEEESEALKLRGEHLDIYVTKAEKAPSMADIQLSLLFSPSPEQAHTRSIAWLAAGISI